MNKKGGIGEELMDNIVYLVLVVLFFSGMLFFVLQQKNGAVSWEGFYAQEIARVVNLAEPGDEILLDVHKGTVIALDNNVRSFSEMFNFDNEKNEICVKLSARKTCYNYFNNVDVEREVKLGVPENVLVLKIKEKSGGQDG